MALDFVSEYAEIPVFTEDKKQERAFTALRLSMRGGGVVSNREELMVLENLNGPLVEDLRRLDDSDALADTGKRLYRVDISETAPPIPIMIPPRGEPDRGSADLYVALFEWEPGVDDESLAKHLFAKHFRACLMGSGLTREWPGSNREKNDRKLMGFRRFNPVIDILRKWPKELDPDLNEYMRENRDVQGAAGARPGMVPMVPERLIVRLADLAEPVDLGYDAISELGIRVAIGNSSIAGTRSLQDCLKRMQGVFDVCFEGNENDLVPKMAELVEMYLGLDPSAKLVVDGTIVRNPFSYMILGEDAIALLVAMLNLLCKRPSKEETREAQLRSWLTAKGPGRERLEEDRYTFLSDWLYADGATGHASADEAISDIETWGSSLKGESLERARKLLSDIDVDAKRYYFKRGDVTGDTGILRRVGFKKLSISTFDKKTCPFWLSKGAIQEVQDGNAEYELRNWEYWSAIIPVSDGVIVDSGELPSSNKSFASRYLKWRSDSLCWESLLAQMSLDERLSPLALNSATMGEALANIRGFDFNNKLVRFFRHADHEDSLRKTLITDMQVGRIVFDDELGVYAVGAGFDGKLNPGTGVCAYSETAQRKAFPFRQSDGRVADGIPVENLATYSGRSGKVQLSSICEALDDGNRYALMIDPNTDYQADVTIIPKEGMSAEEEREFRSLLEGASKAMFARRDSRRRPALGDGCRGIEDDGNGRFRYRDRFVYGLRGFSRFLRSVSNYIGSVKASYVVPSTQAGRQGLSKDWYYIWTPPDPRQLDAGGKERIPFNGLGWTQVRVIEAYAREDASMTVTPCWSEDGKFQSVAISALGKTIAIRRPHLV